MRRLITFTLALLIAGSFSAQAEEGVFTFRVVDEDRIPSSGAYVSWKPYKDGLATEFPGPGEVGETDAEGRIVIDFTAHPDYAEGNFSVRVDDAFDRVGGVRVYPPRDWDQEVEIVVARRELVHGYVRDESGDPIEGVVVGSQWFPLAVTNSEGYFRIHGTIEGHSTMSFYKDGYGWLTEYAGNAEMRVVLRSGVVVTFEMLDEYEQPLPEVTVRYNGIEVLTDAFGRLETIPLAPESGLSTQSSLYVQGKSYWGDHFMVRPLEVGKDNHYRIVMRRTDAGNPNARRIGGRVVMAGTEVPVAAMVLMDRDGTTPIEWGDKEHTSDTDSRFAFENAGRGGLIQRVEARPKDPTLYAMEGTVTVDLTKQSVEDLRFSIARGWAIRGRIVTDDDSLDLERTDVYWQQGLDMTNVIPSRSGEFIFPNLPPDVREVTLQFLNAKPVTVSAPKSGGIVEGVEFVLPSVHGRSHVSGVVVDTKGNPLVGASISFRSLEVDGIKRGAVTSGKTNVDGEFMLESEYPGIVELDVVTTYIALTRHGSGGITGYSAAIISAPERIELVAGAKLDGLHIVVEPVESRMIRGTIRDEQGNTLEPRVEVYVDSQDQESIQYRYDDYGFRFMALPHEPFSIRLTTGHHKDRLLIPGRDFEIGEEGVEIVLTEGRIGNGEDVWKVITGMEHTEENIRKVPGGRRLSKELEWWDMPID